MGKVYRAERLQIGRQVAIKFLHPSFVDDGHFRSRFEREVKILSKLDHPNCISVFDYGLFERSPYLVMEFVHGRNLKEILEKGRLPMDRALVLAQQLLSGLAHAHSKGIIHRDIKPANLLVTDVTGAGEFLRVADFGLAKLQTAGSEEISVGKFVIGTPSYMSPEQAGGSEADERSDIYSAGVVLFELLTGAKPFQSEDPFEIMKMHRKAEPPRLRDAGDKIQFSKDLENVIAKALSKKPTSRFSTAKEFAQALDEITASANLIDPSDGVSLHTIEYVSPEAAAKLGVKAPPKQSDAPRAKAEKRKERRWSPWLALCVTLVGAGAAARSMGISADEMVSAPADLYAELGRATAVSPEPKAEPAPPPAKVPAPEVGEPATAVVDEPAAAQNQDTEVVAEDEQIEDVALDEGIVIEDEPELAASDEEEAVAGEPGDLGDSEDDAAGVVAGRVADAPEDSSSVDSAAERSEVVTSGAKVKKLTQQIPVKWTFAAVESFIKQGRLDTALRGVNRLIRENPKRAYGHYLRGNIYFSRQWWTDGMKAYATALKLNRSYRKNSRLIRNVISALGSGGTRTRARSLLIRKIGRPAIPHLRRATKKARGAATRREAARVMRSLQRRRR
jgi:serine/threonine-protein kinase